MKRPLSVTAIDHPRSVTCPSFSFLFLFLSRIRNFPARREKRKKEKEEEEGEKRADRISVCLQWFTTWKSDGWTEGRKENECAHRYKFVHDGWTDSLPPFLSFQLYGVPLQKKKGLDSPKGLSLQCFYLGLCTVIVYTNAKCLPSVAHSSLGFRGQQWATKRVFVLFPFLRYLRRSFTKIHERS